MANSAGDGTEGGTRFRRGRPRLVRTAKRAAVVMAAALGATVGSPDRAEACGCLSPPVPTTSSEEYAVNQQAEQIIFEVEQGFVTAHVLIRYAGAPEKFAWIVPVPSNPELSLSEMVAFGMIDQQTTPSVGVQRNSLCPSPEYRCEYHGPPDGCSPPGAGDAGAAFSGSGTGGSGGATSAGSLSPESFDVEVFQRAQIGSYDTVVFGAGDASGAVNWLQLEGFIVNDTMGPFMQPYVDDGMLFVAAKLIPGADVDEIRPLRMRYEAGRPTIPLQLTAVAAEPHLTVTSYIYGDTPFAPVDRPILGLDERWFSEDVSGRSNYPMVIARAADEAGGDGFVVEYAGPAPQVAFGGGSGCCAGDFDQCGLGFDGQCQCPGTEFDAEDCAEDPDLVNAAALLNNLSSKYTQMTRLTTRISAEEMTFDPAFDAATAAELPVSGVLRLNGQRNVMDACEKDIIDVELYESIVAAQACAAIYCGQGECAVTAIGTAGCACNNGFVAREFTDLDGQPSVTCVPDTAPVDFAAAGISLPDACAGVDCGLGTCVDVGGFPTCRCGAGAAAALVDGSPVPKCQSIERGTRSPGARNFSEAMEDVRACSPVPPECGDFGWLVANEDIQIQGVICPQSVPAADQLEVPREPTCEEYYGPGGPGATSGFGTGSGGAFGDVEPGTIPGGGTAGTDSSDPVEGTSVGEESGCACTTPGRGNGSGLGSGALAFGALGLAGMLTLRRRRRGRRLQMGCVGHASRNE